MRYLLLAFTALLITSCSAQSIKVLKSTDNESTKKCNDCVMIRLVNSGKENISRVVLNNNSGNEITFDGLKKGQKSAYRYIPSLCACGYDLEVYFEHDSNNKLSVNNNCRNMVKCTNFFHGKVDLVVKAPTLPKDLHSKSAMQAQVETNFVQR